ncbi:MAG: FAD-dependent monooxygenase [Archangium sp.]
MAVAELEWKRSRTSTTEVLVVGAGPTGLTLACELRRRGVRCRLLDKAEGPAPTSRALDLQPRTLELFELMGLSDRLLASGVLVKGINLYTDGKHLVRLDLEAEAKELLPRPLLVSQSTTERLLRERLRELGAEPEDSRELVELRQEAGEVLARVRGTGSRADEAEEEIHARWLVGCDGAHSRVRRALGLPLEGPPVREEVLLADVALDWERRRDEAHHWLHPEGLFSAFPLPGGRQWRLRVEVPPTRGTRVTEPSLELFQRLLMERTGDSRTVLRDPVWMARYRSSPRLVAAYRRGRVFLAGDAAHPLGAFGSQGLNTGLQDAFNLAWKLALVVTGAASPKLLDSYQEERRPVARQLLRTPSTGPRLLVADNALVRFVRKHVLAHVLALEPVRQVLLQRLAEPDVHYRASSLSRSAEEKGESDLRARLDFHVAPRAGDRAPQGRCLRPGGRRTSLFHELAVTAAPTLLLFEGRKRPGDASLLRTARSVREAYGERVRTYLVAAGAEVPPSLAGWEGPLLLDSQGELHERYGASAPCLYFLRPDGYIGFRGQPVAWEPLRRYLGALFRPPAEVPHPRPEPPRWQTPEPPPF